MVFGVHRWLGTITIELSAYEADLLCRWFEEVTNPAPDQTKGAAGKLEDMLQEILTKESKYP